MPSEYLEEDLVSWGKLGIYHRPSQYGFLTTLQQTPPEGEWPESEDPFTFFSDLVCLLRLPHGNGMIDHGETSESMFKYLAAPAEADSKSAFHRFHVMKTLGYVPHFWHWGSGIGKEWKGFSEPNRFEKGVREGKVVDADGEEDQTCGEDEDFDEDTEYGFQAALCVTRSDCTTTSVSTAETGAVCAATATRMGSHLCSMWARARRLRIDGPGTWVRSAGRELRAILDSRRVGWLSTVVLWSMPTT
jgi:hypothetical protein